MLRVVNAQIAVLMRGVKRSQDGRNKWIDEMLRRLGGVLERHQEMHVLNQGSLVTLQAGQIACVFGDAARFGEALRGQGGANVRRCQLGLSIAKPNAASLMWAGSSSTNTQVFAGPGTCMLENLP